MTVDTYRQLCTQVYDLDKPGVPAKALQFYLRHLEVADGPVLEPMCGSGRFLVPFLERRIDIDGVDASPHMLRACRDKCERKGLKPNLYEQLLQDLSLPRRYGFIFIPVCSFGLLADGQEATHSLQRLYEHLAPGGKLVLEVETPRARGSYPGQWVGSWYERPDGANIVGSYLHRYEAESRIEQILARYELFVEGRLVETEVEEYTVRFYEQDEFRKLLEANDFMVVKVTGTYEDRDPSDEDKTLVFECRRP